MNFTDNLTIIFLFFSLILAAMFFYIWLRDRRGRKLSFDDIEHYQKITVVLGETIRIMDEIDNVIDGHGGWPIK